jgi:hypothetical protein
MGLVKGGKRTKLQLARDVVVGGLEMAIGFGGAATMLAYFPEVYKSPEPGLYTLLGGVGTTASLYCLMDGWHRIKNVRFEPEHENDYHPVKDAYQQFVQYARSSLPSARAGAGQGTPGPSSPALAYTT